MPQFLQTTLNSVTPKGGFVISSQSKISELLQQGQKFGYNLLNFVSPLFNIERPPQTIKQEISLSHNFCLLNHDLV